tara:strand:+ start:1995 stop:2687 length:693 start_codon:yes stop_codon:yes gene_type:complete
MLLTPTEIERLTIFTAAEIARKRKAKGLSLNHPETIAYITDEILEGAREGKSVAELISFGSTILNSDDVMPGVSDLIPIIQIEGMFPDGTKLVTVHDPIRPGKNKKSSISPGEIISQEGEIEINKDRKKLTLIAKNTGDRPVQIGSHYHFFETNKELEFDREKSFGFRLDIPAGTAVRFEPGEEKEINLTEFGGEKTIFGLNDLTNGNLEDEEIKKTALQLAKSQNYKGA